MNSLRPQIWICFVALILAAPVAAQDSKELRATPAATAESSIERKFDFGDGPAAEGWTKVGADSKYDPQTGYGFDLGTSVKSLDRAMANPLTRDLITSDAPFLFSVRLPEGNYRVKVIFGDAESTEAIESTETKAVNTVKAETRRLMLEHVPAKAGEFETRTFNVNIRTPKIPDSRSVGLKKREVGALNWDDKLTIEFNGTRPAVCAMEIVAAPELMTVFLLGDSTVSDQRNEPWNSWGQMLTRFFGTDVVVANFAESGESLRSSLGARRVRKVFATIRKGDYLLVQFGHNDMKDKSPDALQTYKNNLMQLVDDTRERGAIPVLVTSMERKSGVEALTLKQYPQTVRDVAAEKKVALIDLNQMSLKLYRAMGENRDALFQDGTHHNAFGSYQLAKCVVQGIRDNVPELANYLRSDSTKFDPARPDDFRSWHIPASPQIDLTKPDGS